MGDAGRSSLNTILVQYGGRGTRGGTSPAVFCVDFGAVDSLCPEAADDPDYCIRRQVTVCYEA